MQFNETAKQWHGDMKVFQQIAFELVTFASCTAIAALMEQMLKGMQRILMNALQSIAIF